MSRQVIVEVDSADKAIDDFATTVQWGNVCRFAEVNDFQALGQLCQHGLTDNPTLLLQDIKDILGATPEASASVRDALQRLSDIVSQYESTPYVAIGDGT